MALEQLLKIAVPALPLATLQYDRPYQDQLNNVQRLFYTRFVNAFNQITGPLGGQYIDCPNGLFFNTGEQLFAATNTMYPVVFDATYLHNAVQLQAGSTSKIEVTVGGVYNFQYTGQVLSDSSSAKTIYLWIARNGVDIGYSTRGKTVSSNNHLTDVAWGFDIDLDVGDYIELRASVTDTSLHLHAEPASAPHPGIPSGVMTVNFIAPLPNPRPTPP